MLIALGVEVQSTMRSLVSQGVQAELWLVMQGVECAG